MTDKFDQELDNAIQKTDSDNAAHYVYYEIENLCNSKRPEDVRKRWIWELLQNAHDARGVDGIIAEVRYNPKEGKLVFLHNGRGFKADEIAHLIKSGTTKDEEDQETYGKFGRGFLTTHLLSPTVKIAGQLDNGSWFDFTLERDNKSKPVLVKSLEKSLKAFKCNRSDNKPAIPDGFTTQFIFPIHGPDAEKAVTAGIDLLEQCAPYVLIFNREFFNINIKKPDKTRCFKLNDVSQLGASDIHQVTVVENDAKMEYLLAENEQQKTSVAVRMKSSTGKPVCLPMEDIPKLFSAFPLVGTNSLSFPATINGPNFLLPPDRDGVQFDKNREIIEEACNLLINLIEHAALESWNQVHQWAEVPCTQSLSGQMGAGWEMCIKNLIKRIRQTPAVLTQSGKPKTPEESMLPGPEMRKNVEPLWDLLKDCQEYHEKLPRRDEATGWYDTIKSWEYEHEAINGRQLASDIQDCSCLKVLQNTLQEEVRAVEWLDRFYDFLKKDELFNNMTPVYSFVPNQVGEFQKLSSLYRDNCIDEELKDISEILGENIREDLRYTLLTSLEDVDGAGSWDNGDIIGDLTDNLEENANENLHSYEGFMDASVRLFAWIVRNEQYVRLPGFTVFAEESNTEKPTIIRLPHPEPDDDPDMELPLAPIRVWNNDLQNYSELFPQRFIIHNTFYDAVPEKDIWQMLDEKKIVRKNVIIRYPDKVSFEEFQPHDPLTKEVEHESEEEITVSDIAFLTKKDIGVIDKVRKTPTLSYKFWCFLTEWLVVHDSKGLEIIEDVPCTCEDAHRCYPALWLRPVVDRKWISLEKDETAYLEAATLASLLRDSKGDLRTLIRNDHIVKLLEALGISSLDFIRETLIDKNDHEAVDNAMIEIVRKSDGNVTHLNGAIKYVEAVSGNENLSEHVENLLEATEDELNQRRMIIQHIQEDNKLFLQEFEKSRDRTRIISKNRSVGKQVEEFVGQVLTEKFPQKKFNVKPDYIGADFEIVELEVTQGAQKLWIEVKSTRNKSNSQEVKMSSEQAKKAVKKNANFLLCVVPIPEGVEIDLETVKENMRFIANIGDRVSQLYGDIDFLEAVREYITEDLTAETIADVRLTVDSGEIGVLIKNSVWEKNGFPLDELVEYLIRTNNNIVT